MGISDGTTKITEMTKTWKLSIKQLDTERKTTKEFL